jgi:hypothetical protein
VRGGESCQGKTMTGGVRASVGEGHRLRTGLARGDAGPGPNLELGRFGPLRPFLLFLFLFHFLFFFSDFCFCFLSFANQFKSDQTKS